MRITITEEDEKWLRQGIIRELIENHNYSKTNAVELFKNSPLPKMLHEDPEYVFHYDTGYWAKYIVELSEEYG
ncbi:MAG: hypothetical protein GY795_08715 [Desulfobacterales bacterium]|nr:hypothetical protein [Desulfobacterales bacterium]